jgi:hypothetical protein
MSIIDKALESYVKFSASSSAIKNDKYMIIVDMTKPSNEKRLYLYNIAKRSIERAHHTAHGINSSDPNNPAMAVSFSNTPNSRKTSLGAMCTGEVYTGKYGRSLKLYGLEQGKNDNVYKRFIVIHSSLYVTDSYIRKRGYCGRSWGCFAVDPAISNQLIDDVKNGTFLFCYGKDNEK